LQPFWECDLRSVLRFKRGRHTLVFILSDNVASGTAILKAGKGDIGHNLP
jgi:hypothetical protein